MPCKLTPWSFDGIAMLFFHKITRTLLIFAHRYIKYTIITDITDIPYVFKFRSTMVELAYNMYVF